VRGEMGVVKKIKLGNGRWIEDGFLFSDSCREEQMKSREVEYI
jgi:hypothetical protein